MTNGKSNPAVLVTGTDTGIGAASVEHLTRLGFDVFAGVLTEAAAAAMRERYGACVTPLVLDVTHRQHIDAAVTMVDDAVGPRGLAGLVNNAGFAIGGPLEYLSLDVIRRQVEVNLFGQIAITQAFLPLLRKGGGRIVNLGSPSGTLVLPFLSPYAASKAAVKAATEALRMELRPWNIPVSIVEPGRILTDIWRQSVEDSAELLDSYPEEARTRYRAMADALVRMNTSAATRGLPASRVAEVIGKALVARHPRARYYVGLDARVLTLAAHLVPTPIRDRIILAAIGRFVRDD